MAHFGSNYNFLVFSDDLDWCRQTFKGDNVDFSMGRSPAQDMILMSKCNHNVVANSMFSWWGAWLNENPDKKVIASSTFFDPASGIRRRNSATSST